MRLHEGGKRRLTDADGVNVPAGDFHRKRV
jgi:hypothetical protein